MGRSFQTRRAALDRLEACAPSRTLEAQPVPPPPERRVGTSGAGRPLDQVRGSTGSPSDRHDQPVDPRRLVERSKRPPVRPAPSRTATSPCSLVPFLGSQVLSFATPGAKLNYGTNKVRFPNPVLVGKRIRAHVAIADVADLPAGKQATMQVHDRDRGRAQARLRRRDRRTPPRATSRDRGTRSRRRSRRSSKRAPERARRRDRVSRPGETNDDPCQVTGSRHAPSRPRRLGRGRCSTTIDRVRWRVRGQETRSMTSGEGSYVVPAAAIS